MHGEELEEAWLYHEIGYCYLSKKEFQLARQHGEKALSLAESKKDARWQLNSCLLIAQAQGIGSNVIITLEIITMLSSTF